MSRTICIVATYRPAIDIDSTNTSCLGSTSVRSIACAGSFNLRKTVYHDPGTTGVGLVDVRAGAACLSTGCVMV